MLAIPRRGLAILQILLVSVPFALWLSLAGRVGLGVLSGRTASATLVVHVALTAAVAGVLVAVALAREPDKSRALGLVSVRPSAAIGWGLFTAVAAYVAQTAAALFYLAITRTSLVDEVANKTKWTSKLAVIAPGWIVPLVLVVGFYEEVLFRGFLLGRLRLALQGTWGESRRELGAAIVISSALFAAGHAYQGPLGVVQTFAMGVVLALVTVRSGSVWPAILAHAIIDGFGLFVLHGIADSS
jgi:membrane protease YdiL (CAAX protease family)